MRQVAIIDDNEAWCFALAYCLEQQGFSVRTFQDPFQFIPVADQFDLALVDFCIPSKRYRKEMDGADLICELKGSSDRPPLLVLMSAFFTPDILQSIEDVCPSADAFISKISGLNSILLSVDQIISTRTTSEESSQPLKTQEVAV